jgi:hypothetical protein
MLAIFKAIPVIDFNLLDSSNFLRTQVLAKDQNFTLLKTLEHLAYN